MTRKWTDEALQELASQTTLDIMEDIACFGRDEVDPVEWAIATVDTENIYEEDRAVFFHMMGVKPSEVEATYERMAREAREDEADLAEARREAREREHELEWLHSERRVL